MRLPLWCFWVLFIAGCATVRAPSGGDKDTRGPTIESSTPAFGETQFSGKRIEIFYSERIQLSNPSRNILISPPLADKPTIKLSGSNAVTIALNGPLRENTTYTINLGEAVSDLTEDNPAKGSTLAFTTGNVLDSLRVTGMVQDAYTKELEANAQVILIPQDDSLNITNTKPYYLARTDEKGHFELQNLRAGPFNLYALIDQNGNSIYDLPNEKIAFVSDGVYLKDSTLAVTLNTFTAESNEQLLSDFTINENWGLRVITSQVSDSIRVEPINDLGASSTFLRAHFPNSDTSVFWPTDTTLLKGQKLIVFDGSAVIDTITYRPKSRLPFNLGVRVVPNTNSKRLRIKTTRPFLAIDTTAFRWIPDSLGACSITAIDSVNAQELHVTLSESLSPVVKLLPGAITGFYGSINDTTVVKNTPVDMKSLGSIFMEFKEVEFSRIAQLLDSRGNLSRVQNLDPTTTSMNWTEIPPGKYRIRVVADLNDNENWDTGNLPAGVQPESVSFYPDEITVRAGWKLELEWE